MKLYESATFALSIRDVWRKIFVEHCIARANDKTCERHNWRYDREIDCRVKYSGGDAVWSVRNSNYVVGGD
jgi:hypothetical protein